MAGQDLDLGTLHRTMRPGEQLQIGDCELTLVHCTGSRVSLRLRAPRSTHIIPIKEEQPSDPETTEDYVHRRPRSDTDLET